MSTDTAARSATLHPDLAAHPLITTDPATLRAVSTDRSGLPAAGLPLGVAVPSTVSEVQEVVALAHRTGTVIVPRGAGSGLVGGAQADGAGIVVDLSALNAIIDIDPLDQLAVVQPGVITADLDRAAQAHGLRYAPDPASAGISTIGGNVATNAGGLHCVKYGATGQAVRALDVVLADGRLLRTGSRSMKSVTGYDLTSLFVGSEGTLGIIVGVTVELIPQPRHTVTLTATFADAAAAARAVVAIRASGIRPAVAEFLDSATLQAIDDHLGSDYAAAGGALLILQTDGLAAEAELDAIHSLIAGDARHIATATTPEASEELLHARRAALPAIEQRGSVLIEDISVPLSELARAVTAIGEISASTGIEVFVFAHAGDGTLHPIISVPHGADDDTTRARVQRTADLIFQLALDLGGTLSGEHGIGQLKLGWVSRELDPVALDVQRAIKRCLDPTGVLNPNKALPPGDLSAS